MLGLLLLPVRLVFNVGVDRAAVLHLVDGVCMQPRLTIVMRHSVLLLRIPKPHCGNHVVVAGDGVCMQSSGAFKSVDGARRVRSCGVLAMRAAQEACTLTAVK